MNLELPKAGHYIMAVSGGVDSVALLHLLQNQLGLRLVVAHFDHGIRPESSDDRRLVQALAKSYGVPFVYDEGQLDIGASEALARTARYEFLHKVRRASGARAIVTAHHQDDALETAIINLLRGSGRKGLTALNSRHDMVRPLLHIPKRDIISYARDQGLRWNEDSTNQDQTYLRNYVRYRLLPRFDDTARARLWEILTDLRVTNHQLDALLANQLHAQSTAGQLDRTWFNYLPHAVALEIMATWLRAHSLRDFDRPALERLVVAAKTAQSGSRFNILRSVNLIVGNDYLALAGLER